MLELRKEIVGIVNISGHNVVTSEITSFVNAGSGKFRIFFKNGVEKEYNVKEANIAALEDAIIKAISHSKLPYGGEIRTMPRFDTFYGPHDMYPPHFSRPSDMLDYNSPYNGRHNPHFSRPVSMPDYNSPYNSRHNPHVNRPVSRPSTSRGGPYINHAANREYGSRYDNGFNNFSNGHMEGMNDTDIDTANQRQPDMHTKLSNVEIEYVKSNTEDYYTLRDRILTTIFQQDEDNGIVVPSFQEFKLINGMKDTWQLTEKYHNHSYGAILEIIEEEVYNFFYLLKEVKVKTVGVVR